VYNGDLIAGGQFISGRQTVNRIASWNGSTWSALARAEPVVQALAVYNGVSTRAASSRKPGGTPATASRAGRRGVSALGAASKPRHLARRLRRAALRRRNVHASRRRARKLRCELERDDMERGSRRRECASPHARRVRTDSSWADSSPGRRSSRSTSPLDGHGVERFSTGTNSWVTSAGP